MPCWHSVRYRLPAPYSGGALSVPHKDVQANAVYVVLVILHRSVASQVLNRPHSYVKRPVLRENRLRAKPMQSSHPRGGN